MSVEMNKHLGRYSLTSNEKHWRLCLYTPHGRISVLFSEDDEPEIDGLLPSEVLDLIEAGMKGWYRSSHAEDAAIIAKIREHKHEIDLEWLEYRAVKAEERAADLRRKIADILDEMEAEASA